MPVNSLQKQVQQLFIQVALAGLAAHGQVQPKGPLKDPAGNSFGKEHKGIPFLWRKLHKIEPQEC